jgi:hypothetical protein
VLALVVICGVLSVLLLYVEVSSLPHLSEAGYGDSYILFDVLRLRRTGVLYRDLSQPPYVPAQYSPLVYVLYAVAGAVTKSSNPFSALASSCSARLHAVLPLRLQSPAP